MSINLLSYDAYEKAAIKIGGAHWSSYKSRWIYHNASVDIIKGLGIFQPSEVLEVGTMGINLVGDSHTMDMPIDINNPDWITPSYTSNFYHDIRNIPWPFPDKKYKLLCALRVWHHLGDKQRECFLEAKRVAENILLVVPEDTSNNPHAKSIRSEQFTEWNNNKKPEKLIDLGDIGVLYLFS